MTIPSEMKALLLVGDGYTKTPSGSVLEAMEPYLESGSIAVPTPGPSQVLIKVIAPRVALRITDEAVQMFGAQGISQDTPLARSWTHLRTLRLADGPDAVHRRQVARTELKKYTQEKV